MISAFTEGNDRERGAGVRIPDDVSITGVDNTDLGATQTPALTTIRTPIVDIGRAAALQLIARLEGAPAQLHQQLPFELVTRGSTGPPPRYDASPDACRACWKRCLLTRNTCARKVRE